MRGRLLIGAAALLGAVGLAGEAKAACSDHLNQARLSNDLEEVRQIAQRATGCAPTIRDRIQARLDALSGVVKVDSGGEESGDTNPPPPPPPRNPNAGRSLTIGQPVRGALTDTSPRDQNGASYEAYTLRATQGQTLRLAMSAAQGSNLDTYLAIGRMRGNSFEEIDSNDDSGGSLNSMISFTPDATGDYVVRARSFQAQGRGAFDLVAQPWVRAEAVARPLQVGEAVVGNLGPESAVDPDADYSFDLWTFSATAGERLQVSMVSYNFDPIVMVGRMQNGRFSEIANNDDRGDGTLNSLLRFVPTETGEYAIRARAFSEPTGPASYQLLVSGGSPVTTPDAIQRRPGSWVRPGSFSSEGGPTFVDFTFPAERGRSYTVRAVSSEFTPIVDVGTAQADGSLVAVDFFGDRDRPMNSAEFTSRARGNYIVRVSAPSLSSGDFHLIIDEVR